MAQYDSMVIREFASRLYDQARSIVIALTLLGLLFGGVGGLMVLGALLPAAAPIMGLFGAFLGGVIGYLIGQSRAFSLKLQAQTALCQVQIESPTSWPTLPTASRPWSRSSASACRPRPPPLRRR